MAKIYEVLTNILDELPHDELGEWIIDRENDGTPEHPIQMPFVAYFKMVREFEKAVYCFAENHPE